ncbi:MAG: NAD(P)-binding protein [Kurthia sp.]|nr:NAD(P)-binding protein [Candidatus Kurthia equi]
MKKVSIVGSGLSGLAAAILLANEGYEVAIYEKERKIGGNFHAVQSADDQIDLSPSFFALPEVLESVFRVVGKQASDYINIIKLEKHTKVYFKDGTEFYLSDNREIMIEQLQRIDPYGAENYDDFMKEIERIYHETSSLSNELQINNWNKLISTPIRNLLLRLKPFESLSSFLRKYFENENIIELLSHSANRGGVSPKSVPAFKSAFLYPILAYSVFTVRGGNKKIPLALKKLALELGVRFYTEKEVTKIHVENNKVQGIQINHQISLESDYILLSSSKLLADDLILDAQYLQKEKSKWLVREDYQMSQFIVFLALSDHFDLELHTVLFSNDVELEAEQLANGEFASNPTVYLYNPAHSEPERYKSGDRMLILTAVPYVDGESISNRAEIAAYRHAIINKLKQHGFDVEQSIVDEKVWTPIDMRKMLADFQGKIYGGISKLFAEAYIQPPVKSEEIKGLYFTFVHTNHPLGSTDALKNGMHLATSIIEDGNREGK